MAGDFAALAVLDIVRSFNLADNELKSITTFASRIAVLLSKPDIKADDNQTGVLDDLLGDIPSEFAAQEVEDVAVLDVAHNRVDVDVLVFPAVGGTVQVRGEHRPAQGLLLLGAGVIHE